jgi:hypothetical protein
MEFKGELIKIVTAPRTECCHKNTTAVPKPSHPPRSGAVTQKKALPSGGKHVFLHCESIRSGVECAHCAHSALEELPRMGRMFVGWNRGILSKKTSQFRYFGMPLFEGLVRL